MNKAERLRYLSNALTLSRVPDIEVYRVNEVLAGQDYVRCSHLQGRPEGRFSVRSAAHGEDDERSSNAGRYLSFTDIPLEHLNERVNDVATDIASKCSEVSSSFVFIHEFIAARVQGVAFSHDPSCGVRRWLVSQDPSGDPSSITGGTHVDRLDTLVEMPNERVPKLAALDERLIAALDEVVAAMGCPTDIEFIIDFDDALWVLQARPLTVKSEGVLQRDKVDQALKSIEEQIDFITMPKPFVLGDTTVLTTMSDWNPAEMIGTHPRPLALSLYRHLITDGTWAYRRHNYGYRNLRSAPLMFSLGGCPYIDVRTSLNSFIPIGVSDQLAGKVVEHQVELLLANPTLHDKIEFSICHSSLTPRTEESLESDYSEVLTSDEIGQFANELRELTKRILLDSGGNLARDLAHVEDLRSMHLKRGNRDTTARNLVGRIYWKLHTVRRYGVLPFVGIARAAFVFRQILSAAVEHGLISKTEESGFFRSLGSVTSDFKKHLEILPIEELTELYGWMRPGTYDVLQPTYAESGILATMSAAALAAARSRDEIFRRPDHDEMVGDFSIAEIKPFVDWLEDQLDVEESEDFLEFGRRVTLAREATKSEFSRWISSILDDLVFLGSACGLSREEVSYVSVFDIEQLYFTGEPICEMVTASAKRGFENYSTTKLLKLPYLIASGSDVWVSKLPQSVPSFITNGVASGRAVVVDGYGSDLAGSIVLIESADPGYDWLFSAGIRGFVTAHGGHNSHMAIRAFELGIPAAIGVGLSRFDELATAGFVSLDCGAGKLAAH